LPPPPLSSAGALLTVVVAADGTPPEQDTAMVTVLAVVANTAFAVVAGPRATLLTWKPCWGLHDKRKTPVAAQRAMTVPPDEARMVPLVLVVPPRPAWDRGLGEEDG
jgi:hypothetical protein